MISKIETHNGFVLFCNEKKPIGVISDNGEKNAIWNTQKLSNNFRNYLISLEDHRFYDHGALDMKAISRAIYQNIKAGKIVQGGSTITQQLARNLIKDNRKSLIRKIRELKVAINLENEYCKDDILDLYFNKVFWGKKNYGVRTASLEYFLKEPEQLNTSEQIALLTLLRGPNFYLKNISQFQKRMLVTSQTLSKRNVISKKKISKLNKSNIKLQNKDLVIFKNSSIPFISNGIDKNSYSISTTLDNELQSKTSDFIANCKYPTSIIILEKGNIAAIGSSHGSDYPFKFRSNVGSTLKPFIYSFLRENGVKETARFSTSSTTEWNIREVEKVSKEFLSLKEALLLSNNNVFVNACNEIGVEKTLTFLSKLTAKPLTNFVPSSILGTSNEGVTLYELLNIYHNFFSKEMTPAKMESLDILNQIALERFNYEFKNAFFKTGTTNLNKERFGIVGYSKYLFGFLRQGNEINDYSKEGGFISDILKFLRSVGNKIYNWD